MFALIVVVVINEADNLTREAQSALRRTMEKYSPNLRLILIANSSTKILAPIRSRCLLVRVAAPQVDDMVAVLKNVVHQESLGKVASGVLEKIAVESRRNLRRALLILEAVYAQKYSTCDYVDLVAASMIQILPLLPQIGRSIFNKSQTLLLPNSLLRGSHSSSILT